MEEPWGFDVEDRGIVEFSEKYMYGPGWEPLQRGEMVRACVAWGGHSSPACCYGCVARPC